MVDGADAHATPDDLPLEACSGDRVDAAVVVVGGGVIGASIALGLARRGIDVVIVDEDPGGGASWGNAGLVVPSYSTPMSTPENLIQGLRSLGRPSAAFQLRRPLPLPLLLWLGAFALQCRPRRAQRATETLTSMAQRSRTLYDEWAADGIDVGLATTGWLWTYRSSGALESAARQFSGLDLACEKVASEDLASIEPSLGQGYVGGMWFPHESTLAPAQATRAVLAAAQSNGARWVRGKVIATHANGRRTTSVTTDQQLVTGRSFVIAAGAESAAVARLFGARVPVQPGYGWSLTIPAPREASAPALMAVDDHVVVSRTRSDLRITGGMQFGGHRSAVPPPSAVNDLRRAGTRLLPEIAELDGGVAWMGARPMTTSGLPVSRRVRGSHNVLVSAGHGPLGMTLAPVAAELLLPHVEASLSRHAS
jgi:D-amino-acid dehydrogenase